MKFEGLNAPVSPYFSKNHFRSFWWENFLKNGRIWKLFQSSQSSCPRQSLWVLPKRTKMFGKISTYTCIQAFKCRKQALFLMQIQNLKSHFRGFECCIIFIVWQKAYVSEVSEYLSISCGQNMVHLKIFSGLGLNGFTHLGKNLGEILSWWNGSTLGEIEKISVK